MNRHEDLIEHLARQELTPAELTDVLERLSCQATTELPTIGAVSEVTGASAEAIGRMLADIRGVSFQEAFGRRLDEHEAVLSVHREILEGHHREIQGLRAELHPDAESVQKELSDPIMRGLESLMNRSFLVLWIILIACAIAFTFLRE